MGGKLKEKWEGELLEKVFLNSGLPYVDIYIGRKIKGGIYKTFRCCQFLYDGDTFPTKRTYVYNHTFSQNMPASL